MQHCWTSLIRFHDCHGNNSSEIFSKNFKNCTIVLHKNTDKKYVLGLDGKSIDQKSCTKYAFHFSGGAVSTTVAKYVGLIKAANEIIYLLSL